MFMLFLVAIGLAMYAVTLPNPERQRPAALVILGLLSIVFGGSMVALVSDFRLSECRGTVDAAEKSPASTSGGNVLLGEVSSDEELSETATSRTAETSISASATPHELAIEPKATFRYLTTPRPEWVETEAIQGDDGYQVAIESGLHLRKRAAQQALRDAAKAAVDAYVNGYLESELAAQLSGYVIEESDHGGARTINLRLDGSTFEIARERFDEQLEFDYGVMNQAHALIKLDKNVAAALDQHWSKVRATARLFQTGLGVAAVLLLLGTMFSYLKLDTATRGYYTGRLQFGAAATILAIVAAIVVCANWIPWM